MTHPALDLVIAALEKIREKNGRAPRASRTALARLQDKAVAASLREGRPRRRQGDGYSYQIKQIYSARFANALAFARNAGISPAPGRKPCSESEIRTPI